MADFLPSKRNPRSDYEKASLAKLIPVYIRELCKSPKHVEIRISYDSPTKQTNFTYSISWDDDMDTEDSYRKMIESPGDSRADLQQSSPQSNSSASDSSSETDCSVFALPANTTASTVSIKTPPSFRLIYPSQNEIVGVKLVIVDGGVETEKMVDQTCAELEFLGSAKMLKAIQRLLACKNRNPLECLSTGTLYYVELQPDWTRKFCRIRKNFERLKLTDFPQIAEHVMFVLDMGGFVRQRADIFLE